MNKFTEVQIQEIKNIVDETIRLSKDTKNLKDILKLKRRTTRLSGHAKIESEKKCSCGSDMICSISKSGYWSCPQEELEWDIIFEKLKIGK